MASKTCLQVLLRRPRCVTSASGSDWDWWGAAQGVVLEALEACDIQHLTPLPPIPPLAHLSHRTFLVTCRLEPRRKYRSMYAVDLPVYALPENEHSVKYISFFSATAFCSKRIAKLFFEQHSMFFLIFCLKHHKKKRSPCIPSNTLFFFGPHLRSW